MSELSAPAASQAANGRTAGARIALVNMPFAVADRPSIQCGVLKGALVRAGHVVDVHYLNLELAAALGGAHYHRIAAPRRNQQLLGEWLFSFAAFGEVGDVHAYREMCGVDETCQELGVEFDELCRLREERLPTLIDEWAQRIDWQSYALVGFSSTFEQNVAALALAGRVKRLAPETPVVFGGSNFDDEMGAEYMRAFDWLDYAVIGEGDGVLCQLVDRIAAGDHGAGLRGVVARRGDEVVDGGRAPTITEMDALADPDYDDYFSALFRLGSDRIMEDELPLLLFESSRGCWWGQKHHCTFCGLNNSGMAYRRKSPERVLGEVGRLADRYSILNFEAVDNIMDTRYVKHVWGRLAEEPYDYRFFYEVKAKLSRTHLRTMAAGGVKAIQPGIESMSTHILKLMRKGTSMLDNVRILKWGRYYGMRVGWNLLLGFPGERPDDYDAQERLLPLLYHFQPPVGVGPVWLERFSPYFFDDQFPVRNVRPQPAYGFIYPRDRVDLDKIAYFFDYEMGDTVRPPQGLGRVIDTWHERWLRAPTPSLAYQRAPDWLQVLDRRDPDHPAAVAFRGDEAAIYEACGDSDRTAAQVRDDLAAAGRDGLALGDVETALARFCELGLMVEEDGRHLSLALPVRRQ